MKFDVIGFGALNLDLIYRVPKELAETLPYKPGEEYVGTEEDWEILFPLLKREGRFISRSAGGSALNTIVALSKMGFKTGYIGKVGEDEEGKFLLESLKGVDKSGIKREGKSGLAVSLLLGESVDRSLIVFPETNDTLKIFENDIKYAQSTSFLHLTSFIGDRPFSAQKQLLLHIKKEPKISFDPGMIYAKRGFGALYPIIEKTFLFLASEEEIEIITGNRWDEGSRALLKFGPQVVVCKRGEKGASVFIKGEEFHLSAKKVEVVDTTGAGDVFNAGFLAGLLKNKSLKECLEQAIDWACQSITDFGQRAYKG